MPRAPAPAELRLPLLVATPPQRLTVGSAQQAASPPEEAEGITCDTPQASPEVATCPTLSQSAAVNTWLPLLVLSSFSVLALGVWPFRVVSLTWPSVCTEQEKQASFLANEGKAALENAVGTAPAWLRSTLLIAVLTQILSGLCGFGECRPLRRVIKATVSICSPGDPSGGVDDDDEDAAEVELLKEILQQLETETAHPRVDELRELFNKREKRLALSLLRKRSLIRLLLTGHGLHPAPRKGAGWLAIAGGESTQASWDQARHGLGLTVRQAMGVSITKLICWHWVQPVAYLWVFSAYYCQLSDTSTISQRDVGEIVAARELLYLGTTVTGVFACPAYLLLDISTLWKEAETREEKAVRTACYLLTPHNFVALSLVNRFQPDEGSGRFSVNGALQMLFYIAALGESFYVHSVLAFSCLFLTRSCWLTYIHCTHIHTSTD